MTMRRLIETFNTHLMDPEVVKAVATGRATELQHIMQAIRRTAESPNRPPQHLVIYGERGSGKSFLLRLTEIEVGKWSRESGVPVVCVLLPEEQYNIKSAPQLIEALAARVREDDWSASAYAFDFRPPLQAWEGAVAALHQALDARFGIGRGIAVAMVENFDVLAKDLFGATVISPTPPKNAAKVASRGKTTTATKAVAAAVERRAAEERLRKLMNTKGERFMLIATATGTVDFEYERPLFQAFGSVDLSAWSSDTAIDYFNRRRALEDAPALTPAEKARARAVAEFIGGNPRLAQLLGNVLNSPDARTIADTLDQLSDHLADYYRRRLDDLPPNAAGLLDALIRGGEPTSQTALAKRVGAAQNQIADAFSNLIGARLLAAASEKDGAGTLYRVNDRLFVHFYRRRYGDPGQRLGLAPIAELLERFFTAQEREQQTRRHLEAGEFAEARLFRDLGRPPANGAQSCYCRYRDGIRYGALDMIFECAGLRPEEVEAARTALLDRPQEAIKQWADRARSAETPLKRTAALLVQARAACRWGADPTAEGILRDAVTAAQMDEATDALVLAQDDMATFVLNRLKDERGALEVFEGQANLFDGTRSDYAKARAQLGLAFCSRGRGQYEEAIQAAEGAATAAIACGEPRARVEAGKFKAGSLIQLDQIEDAIAAADDAATAAEHGRCIDLMAGIYRIKAQALGFVGKFRDALEACDRAAEFASKTGDFREQTASFMDKAKILNQLGHRDDALASANVGIALAQESGVDDQLIRGLGLKAFILGRSQRHQDAIDVADVAIERARQAGDARGMAAALRHKGWSLVQLMRFEEAIMTYDQAIGLAKEVGDAREVSMALSMKARALASSGQLTAALDIARTAVGHAREGARPRELGFANRLFFSIAAQTPAPDFIAQFVDVTQSRHAPSWLTLGLSDVISGAARANAWHELLRLSHGRKAWFANLKLWRAFDGVGKAWADQNKTDGQAQAFATIVRSLPVIAELMAEIPRRYREPEDQVMAHLRDLVAGFVSACSDPGLLRDVADLLPEIFGTEAQGEAQRVRWFAEVYAAEDKEKVLQRLDPDLATAIRRVLNLPEPEDLLAKRRRRKGR